MLLNIENNIPEEEVMTINTETRGFNLAIKQQLEKLRKIYKIYLKFR